MNKRRDVNHQRRGATSVEFALVSIPLFLFVFGSIELCRGLMSVHCLEEAARAACRTAVVNGSELSDIEDEANKILSTAGISKFEVIVSPLPLAAADRHAPITVSISAAYADLTWLPTPRFLRNVLLRGSCTFPKESAAAD